MSRRRQGLFAIGAFAAGLAAGAVVEEVVYRRVLGGPDPEGDERYGSVSGEPVWIESFDGARLYAEAFGPPDAPTVVLSHGFTLTHQVWHHQLKRLAADGRFHAIAYDARGHGRSGPVGGPGGDTEFTPDTLARDLFSVLHSVPTNPAIVVGHSMGGMTVQGLMDFADDFDEEMWTHVRGMVLINTTFTAELGGWNSEGPKYSRLKKAAEGLMRRATNDPRRIERFRLPVSDLALLSTRLAFGAEASPSQVRLVRHMVEATPTETIVAGVRGLASFDRLDHLEKITVPTLICAGQWDILTPLRLAREMSRRIPDAELVVFPKTGHMAMLERHEEFSDLLVRFGEKVLLG